MRLQGTHLTSSLIVVNGNSGPYRSRLGSPLRLETELALPYGLPKLLRHTIKNLVTSKARPRPPISGPHQSLTSALPVKAWQMTRALSAREESFPRVVYATGTFRRVTPDSRVKAGMIAICWSGINEAKGFSGWLEVLSTGFSDERIGGFWNNTDGVSGFGMCRPESSWFLS